MAASIFSKLGKLAPRVRNRLWAPLASIPMGSRKHCVMCGNHVGRFMPFENGWRGAPPLTRALDMVGSNPDHFECPRCGSHDRERHLLLYMQRTGLLADLAGKTVVHFAPEVRLSKVIAAAGPAEYVKCDLFPSAPDVQQQNMLAMSFAGDYADVLIANHVLEHVADDLQAVSEIRRVLKPGGVAILQTPYSPVLTRTWDDSGIESEAARLHAYGQEDHVRLYGRDLVPRICSAGLVSAVALHAELLPDIEGEAAGVNVDEPFLRFEKA